MRRLVRERRWIRYSAMDEPRPRAHAPSGVESGGIETGGSASGETPAILAFHSKRANAGQQSPNGCPALEGGNGLGAKRRTRRAERLRKGRMARHQVHTG